MRNTATPILTPTESAAAAAAAASTKTRGVRLFIRREHEPIRRSTGLRAAEEQRGWVAVPQVSAFFLPPLTFIHNKLRARDDACLNGQERVYVRGGERVWPTLHLREIFLFRYIRVLLSARAKEAGLCFIMSASCFDFILVPSCSSIRRNFNLFINCSTTIVLEF